ncbi:hypothetical protein, partial [Dermacoccus nishinomiyaensis]|uniref:hypothetical protein n=1 Tax=Dermacoccus nishinomiyaensis TaxID=1274 RepID=UPI001642ED44
VVTVVTLVMVKMLGVEWVKRMVYAIRGVGVVVGVDEVREGGREEGVGVWWAVGGRGEVGEVVRGVMGVLVGLGVGMGGWVWMR